MAELTTAVNELLKGRRAAENLHIYTEGLLSLYKRMAYLRLSMNFYTLAEICQEAEEEQRAKTRGLVDKVCALVRRAVIEPGQGGFDTLQSDTAAFRDELLNLMEIFMAHVDRFQVYEYMLNRVEFRFSDSGYTDEYYYNGFERDINSFITEDTDNTAVNMKIADVISQLPMRLSNGKFFDIINNTFTLYKSSDRMAVDDFVYAIRSSGLLYKPEGFEDVLPEFGELDKKFRETDFAEITGEEYNALRAELDRVSELSGKYSDTCIMLTEVVNDVYSAVLTADALGDVNEKEKLTSVISESYSAIKEDRAPSSDAYKIFDEITGLQEKTSQLIYTPELTLDEIKSVNGEEIKRLGMGDCFGVLSKLSRLQSASTFARLEESSDSKECGGEEYAANAAQGLTEEFSALFENSSRSFKRAVMSSVIGRLPVFFNSLKEFGEYVHIALGQCGDSAERQACMSLINMLIRGE
ncbi:MAG: hypothetical protein HDT13_08530 [Butyrivibrio sp.]|nr:hypothetical protein [Butyrivibrio sp.]